MGKRGPQPDPTAIKNLKGNPGKRALNDSEPTFAAGTPECPEWLGEVGKQKFAEYVAILETSPGLLTIADGWEISLGCEAWDEMFEAMAEIENDGPTCSSEKGGMYQHPAVGRKNKAIQRIRQFHAKFGLSPADRASLKVPKPVTAEDPLIAMLMKRAGRN